jgi:tripartite-type tricarboxylate transporter receptor subunit TctC
LQEAHPPVNIGSPASKEMIMKAVIAIAVVGLLVLASGAPRAAQEYPTRPVKIIAGSPGTLMDVVARHVALRLAARLGQPVVVENRGGAGFTIGTGVAAKSPSDGYTLVMSDRTALAAAPHLYKQVPYDVLRDFAPIGLIAVSAGILTAHPSVPASNLVEFLEHARRHPDISWATPGMSTSGHISSARLSQKAGIKPVYVHYKGSAEAQRAILGGDPKVGFIGAPSTLSLVAAGQLKALAVTSARRLAVAPSIPTVAESGFPGFQTEYWVGLLAPSGTPPAVISRLGRELQEIVKSADFREMLALQGAEPGAATAEELASRIRSDILVAKEEAEMVGIRPE